MKKIVTVATTMALALTGLSVIAGTQAASAVTASSNLFALNVANQGTGSAPKDFFELGGKTYFTASTLSKATSLWRVDGDITKEPELLFDPFEGVIAGRIDNIWGYDKFLFFWVQDTKNYSSMQPYVMNVLTKEVKPIQNTQGTNTMLSYEQAGQFAETNGVIYGFANGNWNFNAGIYTFNPIDMNVTQITTTPVVPARSGAGDNMLSPWKYHASFYAVGNYLYITDNSAWEYIKLYRYDLTNNSWSGALQNDGQDMVGVRVNGNLTYNGEKGFVFSEPIIQAANWQPGRNFESFFVKPDGTFKKLGTWNVREERGAFVNLNGDLYVSYYYGREFAKVDPITGEKTDVYATMFPGLTTTPQFGSVREVGDKLVFSINLLGTAAGQFLLYSWDGVGPAIRFNDVNPSLGSSSIHYSASNSNAGQNLELGAMGNYTIAVLNRDPAIGAEPYYVAPDGTVTLMKDMNRATDGSAPQTSCFISTPDGDWMSGNIPEGTPTNGSQSVIVSMKPDGAFLKYSVISVGALNDPCGFTYVGEDIFFQARDTNYENGIYKRSPAGTITKMNALPEIQSGDKAVSYGGSYYWLAYNRYNRDLYKYDVAANTVTKLTGKDGDIITSDGVKDMALVGSKLVLIGGTTSYWDMTKVFIADLAEPTFTITNITPEAETASRTFYPENLMVFKGKAIFYSAASDGSNDVFEVQADTNQVVKFFDIDPEVGAGSTRKMVQAGSKLYLTYLSGGKNLLKRWTSGTMATTMPLDPAFSFQCMAPAGSDIILQNGDSGQAVYYGNGFNMKRVNYDFSGNTDAFCNVGVTAHGTYLSIPEYPYDQTGVGFGREPGYIGPLTPIAVSRLGQAVTEAPAVPLSSGIPSETTPAAPGTPGTPVATPGAGKVTLDWTAPTTGGEVANYIVESTPVGAQCQISGTSAECGGLDDGVAYTFTVTATNAGGMAKSSVSNSAIAGPAAPAPGVPGKPTGVGIEGGIDLTWTAPTTGGPVDSYIVQSNPAGGTCVITGTTARCTGLEDFQSYTFTVLAMNDTDISSSETSDSISAGDPAFAPPGDDIEPPVLTPLSNAIRATVVKSTSGGTPTYYRIRLYDESEERVGQCFIYLPEESCVFEGLDPEMSYNAVSRAYNDAGSSDSSDYSDSVYPLAPSAPGVPGAPTIEAGIGKLTVTATAPTEGGQVLSYDVTLSPGGATCTITAPAVSCEFTGLNSSTNYTATMVAKNDLGTSASSEPSAGVKPLANVPGKPDAPTLVAGPGKVTVTITPPSSGAAPTSYLVTLSPGGKTCTVTAPATTCEVTGLDSTVAYTASVVAKNSEGDSVASDASSSVTPLLPVPGTPAAPTVVVGNAKATVTAAASMTGGAATSLKVTATPGGAFCVITLPATSCEITGLTNKTSYTFATVATNASGDSAASVQSAAAIPVDPNADVAPEEGDGGKAPKGVPSGGVKKFVATNDSSFQVAWDKKTGKLISRATGIYTGYIEAKITFTKAGKVHTCSAVFGVLKVMPQKTAAQKTAAMKSKTFTGKQFCIDKTKLNPTTLTPRGGMTPANFKKIKPMNKSATELRNEKAAATALKNFTGQVDIQVIRYRAWPTTMINVGAHDSKGGKIPALVRNTKVTLG